MDVKTGDMNAALDNIYSTSIDNNEVMELLNQMRDQQTMEAGGQIAVGSGNVANPQPSAAKANDID